MVSPFQNNPLTGIRGPFGVTIFRLDPFLGIIPISPVVTLDGNPDQITMDIVDSEDWSDEYSTTDNSLQDFSSASSNIHRELGTASWSGTLVGGQSLLSDTLVGQRRDLRKVDELRALARRKEIVMAVSPRISFVRCFITSLGGNWNPELGENSQVSISVKEARVVSPLGAQQTEPDLDELLTGNNRATDSGTQAPQDSGLDGTASSTPGGSPTAGQRVPA
jgi:hypothetical protein